MDESMRLAAVHSAMSIGLFVLLYPIMVLMRHWAHQDTVRPRIIAAPLLGLYQAIALIQKRGDTAARTDAGLHSFTPLFGLFPLVFAVALLPTNSSAPVRGASPALVVGTLLLTSAAVALAGHTSGNPLARLDGLRLMVLRTSALAVVFIATLGVGLALNKSTLGEIALAQWSPMRMGAPMLGVLVNPLGLVACVMATAVFAKRAERQRTDQNRELIDTYSTGAAGITFLFHQVLRVSDRIAVAALCAVVFLGGASNLNAPLDAASLGIAFAEVAIKTAAVGGLALLAERNLPPLHHDQAIRLVWGALIPLALLGAALGPVVADALR